ncbi:MAG: 4-hydroxy-tetrahydrodipicolinate synthase [Bacteroidales bacterium]|nr:4-hydroxy-tetrahydrodipicolinate synthase [Bacteroidales bacterium]
MAVQKFTGTGVAVTTPFNPDQSVDHDSLKKHIQFLVDNGIDYLVVLGTTGESVTLNGEEQRAAVNTVLKANDGQLPVVLGLGGNNTAAVLEKMKHFDFQGIDAILSVAPYYNKPSQKGLYQHFKTIAENTPVPVILYNVPGRTGVNIAPETIVSLAHDFDNIIAVKEASGSLTQAMHIIDHKPEDFVVVSGEDNITLPLMSIGVSGVISVAANAFPHEWSTMVNDALKNDFSSARQVHYQMMPIVEKLFAEGNPPGIKCALNIKGIIPNRLRLPLVPVSQELEEELKERISNMKKT